MEYLIAGLGKFYKEYLSKLDAITRLVDLYLEGVMQALQITRPVVASLRWQNEF